MPAPPRFSPSPASWRLDPQRFARSNFEPRLAGERLWFRTPARQQHIPTRFTRSTPRESIRTTHAAIGENRHFGRNQEAKLAHNAIAAAMHALAARILADPIALDPQRVLMLERLNRSVPAIGHVGMRGAVAAALR